MLGVFDGHGIYGHDVSGFIKRAIPTFFQQMFSESSNTDSTDQIPQLLNDIFVKSNIELNKRSRIDVAFSGSTANCILIRGTRCYCANLGDSRAIIGRKIGNT